MFRTAVRLKSWKNQIGHPGSLGQRAPCAPEVLNWVAVGPHENAVTRFLPLMHSEINLYTSSVITTARPLSFLVVPGSNESCGL